MKLEILTVCESANIQGQALSIVAASDKIYSNQAPCIVPQFFIVFRIRFELPEEGEHSVTFSIIDQDGNQVIQPLNKILMAKLPGNFSSCLNIGQIKFTDILFPKFGEYSLDFLVDGNSLGSQPLYFAKTQSSI